MKCLTFSPKSDFTTKHIFDRKFKFFAFNIQLQFVSFLLGKQQDALANAASEQEKSKLQEKITTLETKLQEALATVQGLFSW